MSVRIDLKDMRGNIVTNSGDLSFNSGRSQHSLNVKDLPRGSYVCRMKTGDYFVSRMVVLVD
ncbi:hypothetical protein [Dyadobacter linearis]|uniref:hypothetical protein n=1 Tax=Dyadobacter linearis TaxID=2823330 RepID=UPI003873286A